MHMFNIHFGLHIYYCCISRVPCVLGVLTIPVYRGYSNIVFVVFAVIIEMIFAYIMLCISGVLVRLVYLASTGRKMFFSSK